VKYDEIFWVGKYARSKRENLPSEEMDQDTEEALLLGYDPEKLSRDSLSYFHTANMPWIRDCIDSEPAYTEEETRRPDDINIDEDTIHDQDEEQSSYTEEEDRDTGG